MKNTLTKDGEELMKEWYNAKSLEEMLSFDCFRGVFKTDMIEALNHCGKLDEPADVELFLAGIEYQQKKLKKRMMKKNLKKTKKVKA